jgi:endogenous inhibitor of DNA gyrase (YacG/DUF329 family)
MSELSDTNADSPARIVRCPTCGKGVKWTPGNAFRPFCSERCRLIDLGAWAGGEHRIPGDPEKDDVLSEDPERE